MSDYKNNPLFKQLLTEISSKATTGRIDLSWGKLAEARKKTLKKEAKNDPKQPDEQDQDNGEQSAPETPSKPKGQGSAFGAAPKSAPEEPAAGGEPSDPSEPAPEAPSSETPDQKGGEEGPGEVDKAKEDALNAQAELEKAKAEKGEAEKELEQQSYVHLVSTGGVSFLLGKILDHAFKTNTIDSLATEMVQKLKIQTQEEYKLFSDEMIPFKNIPGVADLLSSMQGMVGQNSGQQ